MPKVEVAKQKVLEDIDVSNKAIAKRIKIARLLAEVSQKELGERIGAKQNTIFKMEAGKSITVERVFAIAEATGQTVGYFLGIKPLNENPTPGQLNFSPGRGSDDPQGLEGSEAYTEDGEPGGYRTHDTLIKRMAPQTTEIPAVFFDIPPKFFG